MESLKIKERRTINIKREAVIGLIASILSVFIVLPYLGISKYWSLSRRYTELITSPAQIFFYILIALLIVAIHLVLRGIFYNVRDISPTSAKSILINQFIYGIAILGFAYYYCSLPAKFNAAIYERFIDNKETFYLTLFSILFYWIGNVIYINTKYFKNLKPI